jgi:transketolase
VRNTFIKTLTKIAEQRPDVWLVCGDLGYSVLEEFATRFPERYINAGVAEQNMAGMAAGLAMAGKTVFLYSIGNFPTFRCLEQIRNDVCAHRASVKVVAVGAGYAYGPQGYTHHALEDVAVMGSLPHMEVFVPCDPIETEAATHAISESGAPAYLRLSRSGEPKLHAVALRDARAPVMLRKGGDVTILACGPVVQDCLAAADLLAAEGVAVQVATLPCVKPLDEAFVQAAADTSRLLVTVEEHVLWGGLHASVAGCLAAHERRPRILGIGVSDEIRASAAAGDRATLLKRAGLDAASIAARIRSAAAAAAAR